MFFVHPDTPALRPTSYFAPRSYEHPNQGYFQLHPNVPRFVVPPYPASQQRFFHQPSEEEIEEREYRRAVAVISNHRRRQAENEAAIRRQRQVEVAHQRDLDSLVVELERRRRRQAEFLSSHQAEIIRTRQALDRLAAAERQIAMNEFLGRVKGAQSVCCTCILAGSVLIFPQVGHRPHVVNRKPIYRVLNHGLPSVANSDDAERIQDILSSFGSRPVRSEKPENPNEDSTKLVEDFLSSLFPGFAFDARPKAGDENTAPASHAGDPRESTQKPGATNIPATSTSPKPSPPEQSTSPANFNVTETEVAEVDRTTSLSFIQRVRNNLTNLQTDFILPTELDHYAPFADDHDDATSPLSASSSSLTKLIPYTGTNKPVYKYENELNGLLEELDRIDSHGDAEVRDKRKETVKAIERALEGVEHVVSEAVRERLSMVAPSPPVVEVPPKGFDVDEDVIEGAVAASTEEQVDALVAVDNAAAPGDLTPTQQEAAADVPVEEVTLTGGTIAESNTPTVSDNTSTTLHGETSPNQPDDGSFTLTAIPESAELTVTEPESSESRLPSEEMEAADTFLLAEEALPRSPIKQAQLIESDWVEVDN